MSTKETVAGKITEMKPSTSENPKAPNGYIVINDLRLTVWDKDTWDSLEVGKEYTFLCTVQDTEYQGKSYTNRNITSGMPAEPLVKSKLKIGPYTVLIDDTVSEIRMPKLAIDYLDEKLSK